jgi:vacuolar-type H+-ATPase subunit E/Vma4
MAKITLADLTREPTTLELFDNTYRVNAITRSVQKKLEKVQPILENIDKEEDGDKVVAMMADALEPLLAPEDGSQSAKRVLVEAWKADTLSIDMLAVLFDKVQEASALRPT